MVYLERWKTLMPLKSTMNLFVACLMPTSLFSLPFWHFLNENSLNGPTSKLGIYWAINKGKMIRIPSLFGLGTVRTMITICNLANHNQLIYYLNIQLIQLKDKIAFGKKTNPNVASACNQAVFLSINIMACSSPTILCSRKKWASHNIATCLHLQI